MLPGPFGPGSCFSVCTHGTCLAQGADALLSDLEEIATFAPIQTSRRGCLGMCGNGPNCLLEQPGKRQAVSRLDSFQKVVSLVKKVLKDTSSLQQDLLEKARVKSDAIRIMARSSFRPERTAEDMQQAIRLLSGAIDEELARPSKFTSARLRSLRILRGKAFGRKLLSTPECDRGARDGDTSAAIADFKTVLAEDSNCAEAYAEMGHIYGFTSKTAAALECYQQALPLMRVGSPEATALQRRVERLREGRQAILEGRQHSGDGSGLWKVLQISGLSPDTCIYHLQNLPPAEPHPCVGSAWHIQVTYGSVVREYTPVSSAQEWEQGRLDLLVKSYADGTVSRFFGSLQSSEEAQEACLQSYGILEEQNCWVRVSAPILTLELPGLGLRTPIRELGIVAGGTGIAPAVQMLSEVAESSGSMSHCCATLLYSSRTPGDVLMLDELRSLTAKSPRVKVAHTLTQESRRVVGKNFRGKHRHFSMSFKPKEGPLQPAEAPFRGRVDSGMLKTLPRPGPATCIVVSGPQGLLDASEKFLTALGHARDNILLLRATATEQNAYPDFSEESGDENQSGTQPSEDELLDMPGVSVSPVPVITISGPAGTTSKPGDRLKAQLRGPGPPGPQSPGPPGGPSLTFADRVRQARGDEGPGPKLDEVD